MLDALQDFTAARRPADVPGRQRLLLAHRLPPRAAGRDRGAARRGRHPHLGGRARRVLPQLHRRIWRPVAAPGPAAATCWSGAGFTAQGFDLCSYYRRRPDSFDPRAAFIFEGVGADETIGDFGLVGGGAAGLELDRADRSSARRRMPWCSASSEGHTDLYMVVCEEILVNTPDHHRQPIRPGARRHGVLRDARTAAPSSPPARSPGCGSLSHNGYDNNVSRITENVLRRFADAKPF